jgi:hypothetical protein
MMCGPPSCTVQPPATVPEDSGEASAGLQPKGGALRHGQASARLADVEEHEELDDEHHLPQGGNVCSRE